LALLPWDDSQADYLYQRLLDAELDELPVIRDALLRSEVERTSAGAAGARVVGSPGTLAAALPVAEALAKKLRQVVLDAKEKSERRLRAACALAGWPGSEATAGWKTAASVVIDQLLLSVRQNPSRYDPLLTMLRPARPVLLAPLGTVYRDRGR